MSRNRIFLLICLLTALFVVPGLTVAESIPSKPLKIRAGAYENYPKVYTDNEGNVVGVFPEILNTIASREGWQIEYVPGSWSQSLARLEKNEIDLMVDVAFSEARSKIYDFSNETVLINWGILYTRKNFRIESLLDLSGKKIAVMKGSIHTDGENGIKNLLQKFNIESKFSEVESYKEVFELLDANQADAGVVNRIFGSLFEKSYDVTKTAVIFNPRQLKFALPKDSSLNPYLIEKIDENIRKLKKNRQSIYHRALDVYLSGQPRDWLYPTAAGKQEKKISLTETEKTWLENHPLIRLGVDPEFTPFEYITDDGTYSGIASDYIEILNKRLGLNMQVVPDLTWAQAVEKAKNKEIDVLPCVGKTQERRVFLRYSRPYIKFQRVIITRTDFPFIAGLDDIRDLKIAVQANTSHEGFLRDNTDIEFIGFKTLQESLTAVSGGKVDAFIGNVASSTYWIRRLNLTNLKVAAPVSPEVLNLYFAVRKDWPELVSIINKGLASISPQEENEIVKKWVSVEYKPGIEPKIVWKYISRIAAAALFVLTVILAWNYRMKKEINERKKMEKMLQYRSEFERLISGLSSHLITLKKEEIDAYIEDALAGIAHFVNADSGCVFSFDQEAGESFCTHIWNSENLKMDKSSCELIDITGTPWWTKHMLNGEVVAVSSVQNLPEDAGKIKDLLQAQGIRSFVDVPNSYQHRTVGFLRLCSKKDGRTWSDDEISLLKLVSQVFTNALLRKQAEEAVQAYAEELEEANIRLQGLDRLKSMFIASMSHELRTPLNSIIGFTGVVLQGMSGELNDRQQDQLNRVYRSAKHLLALITDVIDISKIEAGRVEVYPEPFSLTEIVNEAIANIQPQLKPKNLSLEVDVPDDLKMNTDRKRLLQCIINYASNALKFTEKGGIKISACGKGDEVEILVQDTGIGINTADIPKLFKAFERLESHLRVKAGGTGLGLYLTRKLATELLRGKILVDSEPGKGSTFGLRIPKDLTKKINSQPTPSEVNQRETRFSH
jgi:signal transduction histidine kinase/ABC-type amino acid transport substrate-binding protein